MRAPTELLEKEQSSSHYGMRLLGGKLAHGRSDAGTVVRVRGHQ